MAKVYIPTIWGSGLYSCGMNRQAAHFTYGWLPLLGDRVSRYRCDVRLVQAAQQQAEWLAVNDFEEDAPHLGEGGSTANQRVRATGYRLLGWHENGNTVESASHSGMTPEETAISLSNHDTHRDHMLSLNWYSDHCVYGTGYANYFYVHLIAPEEEK